MVVVNVNWGPELDIQVHFIFLSVFFVVFFLPICKLRMAMQIRDKGF